MEQVMPGTLTPEQMRMQALVQALRQPEQVTAPVQQQGRVQAASDGIGQFGDLLGQGLGQGVGALGRNLSTANTYGTNPFSQQTNMLAAQDAAFR